MTAAYVTTLELARYLNIEGTIPGRRPAGASNAKENVGTGNGSNTLFYLDYGHVIASSYTLYYGASESAAVALTEATHYTLNKDTGVITLTGAGVTLVSTNNIYAAYSYCLIELTDTFLQEVLDRAESEVKKRTNNNWADGTSATPAYIQVTGEKHSGKGKFDRDYYADNFPIPDVSASVSGTAVTTSDTTIYVDSTSGFPSSGTITIESDKITYAGKTTTTFTGCAGVDADHAVDKTVRPWAVEISTTDSGTSPTWTVLEEDVDYDIDFMTGKVHLYKTDYDLTYYALRYPPVMIPNRFKITYVWGHDTIPDDVKRLVLMIAVKDMIHGKARRSAIEGMSQNAIQDIPIDDDWIEKTITKYTNVKAYNV